MYKCTIFIFSFNMDEFLLEFTPEKHWNGIAGYISEGQDKWPHYAMQRIIRDKTKIHIPVRQLHCFHLENFRHRGMADYYFICMLSLYPFSLLSYDQFTPTPGDIRILTREDLHWDPKVNLHPNVRYLLAMIRTRTMVGDLMQLDPNQVNSLCPL